MELEDLIIIGKLGFNDIVKDWIPIRLNPDFLPYLEKLKQAFLIYTDHRVRYITVSKSKFIQGKWYLKIKEPEAYLEFKNLGSVDLAIETLTEDSDEDYYSPVGMEVFFNDQTIGKIIDWFDNGAHDVFVIQDHDGKEILIPDVKEFIQDINIQENRIIAQNIQAFLDL